MANGAIQKAAENGLASAIVAALGRRSIVLVGMMGAGKSSVGRRLAARLGIPFVDADAEIESAAGMTIAGNLRQARRARFPRRRKARDRPAVGQRPASAGDRRRLVHGPEHPRPDPHQGHLGLAEGRPRRADEAHQAAQRPPAGGTRSQDLLPLREPVYALSDIVVQSRDEPHDIIVDEIIAKLAEPLGIAADAEDKP